MMLSIQRNFLAAVLLAAALAPQMTLAAKCPANCFYSNECDVAGQCDDYCNSGYGLTLQKKCRKCPQFCEDCDSANVPAGQCSNCAPGYGLSASNTCTKCPEGCDDCDLKDVPAGQCSSCADGFGLTAQNTCAQCINGCSYCDSADVPAGQCSECDYGYDLTPQKTCAKDCSRYDCCNYNCPLEKSGTCSEDYGNFGALTPIKVIKWKTTAKRLTVKTCQAACLKDPSCFAYRFWGTQNCVGQRPCTRCDCKVLGQHEGDCSLYGENAKDGIQAQSSGTGYIFITRIGGYCWH